MEHMKDDALELLPEPQFVFTPDSEFWDKVQNWYSLNMKNYYLSGFFLKKIREKHSCQECAMLKADNIPQFMQNKQAECFLEYECASHDFSVYLKVRKCTSLR